MPQQQAPQRIARELEWLLKEKYGGRWQSATDRDARRLLRGEPVDYLIGWMPFLGCRVDLSERPMIPRPETEHWVEQAITQMRAHTQRTPGSYFSPPRVGGVGGGRSLDCERPPTPPHLPYARGGITQRDGAPLKLRMIRKPLRVLDLFAGSGCIGIAVLKHIPRARVDFGDSDPRCYSQILKNLRINGVDRKRARTIRTNVFSRTRGRYDFILANPPYIPTKLRSAVTPSVLRYEPARALFGGSDGLTFIRKLISAAPQHLTPGGELWFEFDHRTKRSLERLLKSQPLPFSLHRDQCGKWRYVRVTSH